MTQTCPVTYVDAIRDSTTSATSSGCADRFSGAMALTAARTSSHDAVHGVSTRPGATALTRTSGPTTFASSRVTWLSAALLAAYGIDEPVGRTPASDDTLTTQPAPVARRCGIAATVSCHVPTTLTSYNRRNTSGVAASRSPCGITIVVPALFTRTSS